MSVGVVILAAGASTRMGTPKQLLRYGDRSLIQYVVDVAITSVCHPVVVVLGANAERIQPELEMFNVQVVYNLAWAEGMSTSLRAGIEVLECSFKVDAVVLMVCDQPFVSTSLINQLVLQHQTTREPIIPSSYADILGVPALFHRTLFSELTALRGDSGARQIIKSHRIKDSLSIPFPQGVIDLDTPQDCEQI
jgi:molybdenum cofactor cytidylyltransferase